MFSIFLLLNYFFKSHAFHNFFLFYCLNKHLLFFFNNFFTSKFFKTAFSIKRNLGLNKKFRKYNSVKPKNFRVSRRKLNLRLKSKNKKKIPVSKYTRTAHNFFLIKLRSIRSNAIFLTHQKVPNFSNFLIVNNLVNPNTSYFYFRSAATLKPAFYNQAATFNKNNKNNSYKLKVKLFLKKFRKNNIYHFLENSEYRFNKEKNFYFVNTHYSRFASTNRKIKKKKFIKKNSTKFKRIKLLSAPFFVKKFKKATFLFRALFKYLPKKFFKARRTTLGFFRSKPHFFLWSELKISYFDIWLKLKIKKSRCAKLLKKFKFAGKPRTGRKLKNCGYAQSRAFLNVPSKYLYYRPILITTILFTSKWKAFFLLENLGFLLSTVSEFNTSNFLQNLANFRKDLYSFTMKNELQKKLLKKYFFANSIDYYATQFDRLDVFLSKVKTPANSFFFTYSALKFFLSDALKNHKWPAYGIKKNFWNYENIEEMDLTIKRVRFKPGFSIIWREARTVVKSTLNVNFRYQHRLTKYLLKFRKIVKFKLILVSDTNFLNLVLKTKFAPDYATSSFFFKNNFIFLNYVPCTNENLQIFAGDFVQLVITCKYYLMYKNLISVVLKKKRKLDIMSKKKNFVPSNPEEKKRTNNYPKWVLQNKNILEDIPKFLEIDFYTLSCFVIYEPFLWSELNPADLLHTKFGVINVYNWKYIN